MLFLLLTIPLLISSAQAKYSGGTGEPNDPYLIATAEDMNQIGAEPNDWDKHFLMTADINLADYTAAQFNIIGKYIGYNDPDNIPFTGVFDGNSHTISNFTYAVVDTDGIGLFGYVDDANALIKDLTLTDPNIEATGHWGCVGAVVGLLEDGMLSGCAVEGGSVSADSCTGGLVGKNREGTISNCYATGAVSGYRYTGGLVGYNEDTISNCYAAGAVSGNDYTGGLVGYNIVTISNCCATGFVSGSSDTGGLVGHNRGMISNSFWDIETTGQSTSAGGEGKTTAEMKTMSTFFGWGCGPCVWTIDETNDYPRLVWEGKPGEPVSPILSDLLDGAGTQNDPYLIYTADELNTIGLFSCEPNKHFKVMADIDLGGFSGTEFNIIPVFTGVFDGNNHTISNFTYAAVDTGFIGFFGYVNDANALIKNLTLTDPNIEVAGNSGWVGAVVGGLRDGTISGCVVEGGSVSADDITGGLVGWNGGTISNCYATGDVSGSSYYTGGLVGSNNGTISNCYAAGDVSGSIWYTGGLVGYNYDGTISNCYTAGNVSGDEFTGGLVGYNYYSTISDCYAAGTVSGGDDTGGLVGYNSSGPISNCYAIGDVSGSSYYTGGLVGKNYGPISNCYAAGAVSGDRYTGGLVGSNRQGTISNCYATGLVSGSPDTGGLVGYNYNGMISNSFWDIETTGQSTSDGGEGKTTTEMQTETIFTDAGWDFVDETANGTEDIWTIHEGVDYPKFIRDLVNFVGFYRVDMADYSFLADQWLNDNCGSSNDCGGADLNFSGTVDMFDLGIFVDFWLEGAE